MVAYGCQSRSRHNGSTITLCSKTILALQFGGPASSEEDIFLCQLEGFALAAGGLSLDFRRRSQERQDHNQGGGFPL